jgi:hypothetical protein
MNESHVELVVAQSSKTAETGEKRSWHAPQARVVSVPGVTALNLGNGTDGLNACHS